MFIDLFNVFFGSVESLTIAIILLWLLIDRFILKRGVVRLKGVNFFDLNDGYYRFHLQHKSSLPLNFTQVSYELRDLEHPTTVISGKPRTLDFSKHGLNNELLLIKSSLVTKADKWIINVKVVSAGSWYNPLYKIFPHVCIIQNSVLLDEKGVNDDK